ncbi:MAG TPA: DUF2279 domain-containing protein [Gemmatimonadaceae bacterium]|nr:DUF2279 domain-containing protein [Gemmatimonadaceae bacterium]
MRSDIGRLLGVRNIARLLPAVGFAAGLTAAIPAGAQSLCDSKAYRVASRTTVGTAALAGNVALYQYFRQAWWSGARAEHMWVNWEHHEPFREMDKFGHAYAGYHLARLGGDLLGGACVSRTKAVWYGAAYAAAFQLQIEYWDGKQAKYGFSPPDLIANTAGAGYAVAQHYYAPLRFVKPTISYARTTASRRFGRAQGSELRPTTDYSGQTYWLSVDVDGLLPASAARWWPGFVRASVGHSITDYVDPVTGRGQWAKREIVLSLDLDPEKLPGNNPVWRRVKHELSYYRFPAPALRLTPTVKGVRWYR